MARRYGNPAIVSVGDRRRTGADGRPVRRVNAPLRCCLLSIVRHFPVCRFDAETGFRRRLCMLSKGMATLTGRP